MSAQLELLPAYLLAHLQLVVLALVLSTAISVPLGVAITRRRALEAPLLGLASVIQTVPSLALLAIMVPALAALGGLVAHFGVELRSIGYLPAIIALTLYGMLPILRNTVTGIAGVNPALVEAARGVGMTQGQQLLRVELPLALPVIAAGLRTATVWVVGTATLSTPVGATSLGNFIFSGLQTRNDAAVALGCVSAALLALLLDQSVRLLETGLREGRRGLLALLLAAFTLLGGVLAFKALPARSVAAPVVVGAKGFTEQFILAEVVGQWVRAHSARPVTTLQSLGTSVIFDGLRGDEIALSVDYSGTIWADLMERESGTVSRAAVLRGVRVWLREMHGIETVAVFGFENAYALAMKRERARVLGVRTLSDLARAAPQLEIGGDIDFFDRAEWRALRARYGFAFRARRSMDSTLMYQAVNEGQVDVISAYSTDGRIASLDLLLLEDDLGVIPPYDAMLLASPKLSAEAPELLRALARLEGSIDEAQMQQMNFAVDQGSQSPEEVARTFVERQRGGRQ